MLSKTNRYAIRAVLFVACHEGDGPVRANAIAGALRLPQNYLSKILHVLARAGVLSSERGPRGGFRLGRSPLELTLADVIEPFEPTALESGCLMGRPQCSDDSPCLLHDSWKCASEGMQDFFRETAVAELLQEGDE